PARQVCTCTAYDACHLRDGAAGSNDPQSEKPTSIVGVLPHVQPELLDLGGVEDAAPRRHLRTFAIEHRRLETLPLVGMQFPQIKGCAGILQPFAMTRHAMDVVKLMPRLDHLAIIGEGSSCAGSGDCGNDQMT